MRRAGRTTGYVIAFSFGKGAVREVDRAKKEGLDIRLIKVHEVLLTVTRPGFSSKFGPQPPYEEALLLELKPPKERRSAAELIRSDQEAAG